jgi:uncharacterized protein (DUF302 family)/RNA polymerase-binding transcription factor DksA
MNTMYYTVTTKKTVAETAEALQKAVQNHGFGVLHVYDLKQTLTSKGHPLAAECRIFEVCNPKQASQVLARDMRLNAALPCRISVFEDEGTTKISTIKPSVMLGMLSGDERLAEIAESVEASLTTIINEAAADRWGKAQRALLARRTTLAGEIETGGAKQAVDRAELVAANDNVPDSAERAFADVVLDVDRAEIDRDFTELAAVDAALTRIDLGSYGSCIDCGQAIEAARLETTPEASRCLSCQERIEKRTAKQRPSL